MFIFGEAFVGLLEWTANTVVCKVEPKTFKKKAQINGPIKPV